MAEIDQTNPLSTGEVKEPAPSTGPGAVLRNEREKKGLTLDQVASIIMLRPKIVEALENETWGDLPQPVFVKGFIRSYAEALGLDGKEMLHLYERVALIPNATGKVEEPQRRSGKGFFLLAAVLALILGFIAYLQVGPPSLSGEQLDQKKQAVLEGSEEKKTAGPATDQAPGGEGSSLSPEKANQRGSLEASSEALSPLEAERAPEISEPAPAVDEPAEAQAMVPAAETQAETASPDPYVLKAVVLEQTWVRIHIDNGEPKEYIFQPGARPQWKAKEGFHLTVGNAAGIELELNGTKLKSLGKSGKVVKRNLPESFRPTRSEG